MLAETKKAFGKLDILVNNAGVYEFAPLEEITAEHFHKMYDLNVLGLLLVTQEAVKNFDPEGGSIINISSVAATLALPRPRVYSGTKAAVDAVTRSLAKELGVRKIRVNSINPGMVETEGTHTAGVTESEFRKAMEAQTPLGRIGQTSRHRASRRVFGLFRLRLDQWRNAANRGRSALIRNSIQRSTGVVASRIRAKLK